MRRVEEEFQRKRAREKANIRQQLRLVSSGANSMPTHTTHHSKPRDSPDGSCRESPAPERSRDSQRHSNASSEISGRSKSSTPIRSVELSAWRTSGGARVYRDWSAAHAHPAACARMPIASQQLYNEGSGSAFSGSPVSDNYRREFARGRSSGSPLTPRAPRLLPAADRSTSGSDLSLRHPIKIRWWCVGVALLPNTNPARAHTSEPTKEEPEQDEPAIVPTLRPAGPARTALLTHWHSLTLSHRHSRVDHTHSRADTLLRIIDY